MPNPAPETRSLDNPVILAEERQRRGRLVLRALPILLIPTLTAGIALASIRLSAAAPAVSEPGGQFGPVIPIIVSAVFLTALILLVRVGRPTFSALLLIGVWTLATTVGTLRGGITGLGPAFLIIPIITAGLLIDGVASLSLAALASVLVVSLAWLEISGLYLAPDQQLPMPYSPFPLVAFPAFSAAAWAALYWTVALLTSLLAGGLQNALRQSREQAQALRELSAQLEARVAEQTAELARRATRAEALYEVSRAVTSTLDLSRILALITGQAAHLLGFDSAAILMMQPDGRFTAMAPDAAENSAASATEAGGSSPAGWQPAALAGPLQALEPLIRQTVAERSPRAVALPLVRPEGTDPRSKTAITPAPGTALILPMHYGDRAAGALVLTAGGSRAECDSDDLVLGQGLADQAAVAIANAQLLDETRAAATLEERARLAREIHDTLAQGLTGVVVQLGAAQRAFSPAPAEAREHLAVALQMARESLAEARRSVWNLRAPALQRGELADALRALTLRPFGADVAVAFTQTGQPWALSSAVESTLLRVAQEALVNVAKHAQASEAYVLLAFEPDKVQLQVRDNGAGADQESLAELAAAPGLGGGFGLIGMRERMAALGGALEIRSEGGMQILASVPRPGRREGDT